MHRAGAKDKAIDILFPLETGVTCITNSNDDLREMMMSLSTGEDTSTMIKTETATYYVLFNGVMTLPIRYTAKCKGR